MSYTLKKTISVLNMVLGDPKVGVVFLTYHSYRGWSTDFPAEIAGLMIRAY